MAKNKGNNTVETVRALIEPKMQELSLRVWDVRYEKEGPDKFLRIFIEGDEPMDMDTCEAATRAINPILDEADPIEEGYFMEVGSPGLGRKLTRDEHFTQKQGETIEAVFIRPDENGDKSVRGTLKSKKGTQITLDIDGTDRLLDLGMLSFVKLCDDDDLF